MKFDVVIIGSGLAGLSVALHLAENHQVAVVTKRHLLDGASNWAQGGIAAVLDSGDSYAQHIEDTLIAGAGLCDEAGCEARRRTEPSPAASDAASCLGCP